MAKKKAVRPAPQTAQQPIDLLSLPHAEGLGLGDIPADLRAAFNGATDVLYRTTRMISATGAEIVFGPVEVAALARRLPVVEEAVRRVGRRLNSPRQESARLARFVEANAHTVAVRFGAEVVEDMGLAHEFAYTANELAAVFESRNYPTREEVRAELILEATRAATEDPTGRESIPPAEGPIPPDLFRWQGETAKQLTRMQWQLLQLLWGAGHPFQPVLIGALLRSLYPGDGSRRALLALRDRAEERLNKDHVRLTITNDNGWLQLTPIAART